MGGTGAYVNAKHTRDAVGETLLVINNLLSMIGKFPQQLQSANSNKTKPLVFCLISLTVLSSY
jgi:hypothetical protein